MGVEHLNLMYHIPKESADRKHWQDDPSSEITDCHNKSERDLPNSQNRITWTVPITATTIMESACK